MLCVVTNVIDFKMDVQAAGAATDATGTMAEAHHSYERFEQGRVHVLERRPRPGAVAVTAFTYWPAATA